ncbi:MAG: hypothetical protein HY919_08260 [Elusimicrobia bacterium]|nr:hypothetical protein [Elusimicrobiota bacterium]
MSRKFVLKLVLFCLLTAYYLPLTTSGLYGEVAKSDFGIGVNYPGLGTRYFLSDKISLELKGQIEKDIFVGGLRGYWYFSPEKKLIPFAGLEADFVTFKGDDSKGTGIAGEVFIGGEYFFAKSFSVQLDLGPAFVSLKDKDTSESVNGLEYVVNFSINYYFGK